jgi:hypothetical protein
LNVIIFFHFSSIMFFRAFVLTVMPLGHESINSKDLKEQVLWLSVNSKINTFSSEALASHLEQRRIYRPKRVNSFLHKNTILLLFFGGVG